MKIPNRRLTLLGVCFALLTSLFAPSPFVHAEDGDIGVIVNGKQTLFDVPPRMENDRTLVPMRKVFEMLGAEIPWDQATTTATAVKDSTTVVIKFTDNVSHDVKVNGKQVTIGVAPLEVPPKIVDDRTLVPLRFVSETFGADVNYDYDLNTVFVVTPMKLSTPEKITTLHLSSEDTFQFVDDKGAFVKYKRTATQAVECYYYDPVKKQSFPLPDNTSFGVIENVLYYTPTEGSKEINSIALSTMQPGTSYTLPFGVYSYTAVGKELAIMSTGLKYNDLYRWNPKKPNDTMLVQTPNDNRSGYSFGWDGGAGIIFYHKVLKTGEHKEYVVNSLNGKYKSYLLSSNEWIRGISMDGRNQFNNFGKPTVSEKGLPQSNIKSWLDTKNVVVLQNGNLTVNNVSTGTAQSLASNVDYIYRYGTILYYVVAETDGSKALYRVSIR